MCWTRGGLYNMVHKGKGESVAEKVGQPEYRRVMGDLLQQITDDRLKVGEPIPSTATLTAHYGVSSTVVRRAVRELTQDGVLVGQPGKAVFVLAKPDDVLQEQFTLEGLALGLAQVRSQIDSLQSPDTDALQTLRTEVAGLQRSVDLLQSHLMDLYGRLGQPYPRDTEPPQSGNEGRNPRKSNGA
jgi:Transcriptional regulators